MLNPFAAINKGVTILVRRLRDQGLATTLVWLYARGLPKLTGVPLLRFSQITPQVYVGPQYGRRGLAHLKAAGLTHGINMRIEFDDAAHGLALPDYLHLPTVDDEAPSIEHLDAGVAFMQQAVATGGKVYIHCAGGIGRAPTMAAAYFMRTGLSLEDSLALIRQTRSFISITPPQMVALRRYEQDQHSPAQVIG